MDSGSIAVPVGGILTVASAVLGAKYKQGKGKAKQLLDLLNAIIEAAEARAEQMALLEYGVGLKPFFAIFGTGMRARGI